MWRAIQGAAALSVASAFSVRSAWAEVCDKTVPWWNPADGPVTIAQEAYWAVFSPLGGLLAAGIVLSVAFRKAGLGYAAAAIGLLLAVALVIGLEDDIVVEASVREGCSTGYPTQALIYGLAGMAALVSGWLTNKSKKNV